MQNKNANCHDWVQTIFTILTFLIVGIGGLKLAYDQKEISKKQMEISNDQKNISEQQNQMTMTINEPIIKAEQASNRSFDFTNIGTYAKNISYPEYVYCIHIFTNDGDVYIPIKDSYYLLNGYPVGSDKIYSIVKTNDEDKSFSMRGDIGKEFLKDGSKAVVAYAGVFLRLKYTSIFDITKNNYFYIENDNIVSYNTQKGDDFFAEVNKNKEFSINSYDVDEIYEYAKTHFREY
jgi:hypothetical protein